MNRTYLYAGAAVALALALAAIFLTDGGETSTPTATAIPASGVASTASAATNEETIKALKAKGYLIGDAPRGAADAAVTMIEYASFTCPACAAFHRDTLPTIKTKYIDTGKVAFVIREVTTDRLGVYAAAIARCSGSTDAYHALVDVFFDKQREWSLGASDQAVTQGVAVLKRFGKLAGMSEARMDACLTDQAFLQHIFDTYQANATKDRVEATPTVLIGSQRIRGVQGPAEVGAALDAALGE